LGLEPGSPFGPYRIAEPLGRGGMAAVYRARDPALDRDVALKILPPEFLHEPSFAERFRQEARVAARLEHPHVLPVHAFGIEQGRPWMAMRLVGGGSLAERLQRGPLPPSQTVALLGEVASALDYAHARGVVHRDVKPANVLLDEDGRAYLADFGIARLLEGSSVATQTGLVVGTPSYMAPEQALGSKVDARADVYALGVVAFECLTGRVPYTGTTPVAILMKHVSEPVPEPAPGELPAPVAAVLRRCLAKATSERWPTAGAFVSALEKASSGLDTEAVVTTLPELELPESGETAAARRPPAAWRWAALGIAGALLLASAAGIALAWRWGAWPRPDAPASPSAVAPPVAPPAPSPRPGAANAEATASERRPAPAPSRAPAPRRSSLPAGLATATSAATAPASRPTPAAEPTTSPYDLASRYGGSSSTPRRLRVFCEAKLEPVLFRNTGPKDVSDSLSDLRRALGKLRSLELVSGPTGADAVVQVLERGREPARIGMRKLRVRVLLGAESVELTGQDSLAGFNTWSGAANGAARQLEAWLASRRALPGR
jgi:serine/threonine-protein kinase